MKKLFLLLTTATIGLTINSQNIGLGLRYGVGINSVSTDQTVSGLSSLMTPLNFALVSEFGISDNFSIQPELGMIQKGFSVTQSGVTADAKFTYLGLNVLPKLKFGNETIEGFAMVGPSVNFNLSASVSASGVSADINDVAGLDLSGVFGAGAAYKLSSGKIFLDGRYNLAFLKANSSSNESNKLNQIGFNIGYIHTLK